MNKLEQAARQVVDAWDLGEFSTRMDETITALREALEQLNCQCGDKCFPIFSGDIEYCETCGKPTALAEPERYNHETGSVLIPNPLAEQAEQEPVAEVVLRNQTVGFGRTEERKDIVFLADVEVGTKLYTKPQQAEQEPVCIDWDTKTDEPIMGYAAPVRTKDLTDDEISRLWYDSSYGDSGIDFARAVIQEYRRKNGIV